MQEGERERGRDALVVVVLSPKDVDVKRDTGALGERLEHVRDHLGRQVADLLALELQVAAEVGARRDVEDGAREGLRARRQRAGSACERAGRRPLVGARRGKTHLVEGRKASAVPPDALALAERLLERLAERDGAVLDRVVVVDLEVALALELERHLAVLGERVEHLRRRWRCREGGEEEGVSERSGGPGRALERERDARGCRSRLQCRSR